MALGFVFDSLDDVGRASVGRVSETDRSLDTDLSIEEENKEFNLIAVKSNTMQFAQTRFKLT